MASGGAEQTVAGQPRVYAHDHASSTVCVVQPRARNAPQPSRPNWMRVSLFTDFSPMACLQCLLLWLTTVVNPCFPAVGMVVRLLYRYRSCTAFHVHTLKFQVSSQFWHSHHSSCHHHLCCFRSADFAMDIAKLAHSQARGVAWMGLIFRYCLRFETTVSAPPSVFSSVCSVINTHSMHQNTTAQHTHTHTHHAAQPNEWFTSVCMH